MAPFCDLQIYLRLPNSFSHIDFTTISHLTLSFPSIHGMPSGFVHPSSSPGRQKILQVHIPHNVTGVTVNAFNSMAGIVGVPPFNRFFSVGLAVYATWEKEIEDSLALERGEVDVVYWGQSPR